MSSKWLQYKNQTEPNQIQSELTPSFLKTELKPNWNKKN